MDKERLEAKEAVKKMKFSEKLKYYWGYYKLQIILIASIVFILVFSIYQFCNTVKYDLEIVYYGNRIITDEQVTKLTDYLSDKIEDIDGNGEKNVNFVIVNDFYSDKEKDSKTNADLSVGVKEKFIVEIASASYSVYVVTPDYYDMMESSGDDRVFEVSDDIENSDVLKNIFNSESMTEKWCTRAVYEYQKDDEKQRALYNNAMLARKALFEIKE